MGKREPLKMNKTQGFLYLGHSNWTISSLLSCFVPTFFHLPTFRTGSSLFLLLQREEGRKEQELKMGKRESLKSE